MRILRRPMFRKGGSANEGIMHGLDRKGYANGSEWENTTQSEWEDIAKAYQYGQGEISSTDYEDPKNIEKWSEPGWDFDLFKWAAKDKVKERAEKIKREEALAAAKSVAAAGKIPGHGEGMRGTGEWFAAQKDDGGIDGISDNDAKVIIADKKSALSDRAKEFAELLSPGAQKRAIYDALAAASEKFGESTGNTKQDIANAISAAAAASRGARDTYQKARLLAIEENIKKTIAEAGKADYKPNATEALINFYRGVKDEKGNRKYNEEDIAGILTSKKGENLDITDFLRSTTTTRQGHIEHARWQQIDNPNFAGILPENRKGEIDKEEAKKTMVEGKIYFDQSKRMYVEKVIKDGVVKIIPATS